MNELLPCPFCGGEAVPFNPFGNVDGTWCVLCSKCGAASDFEQTEAEAIAAWNKRVKRYPESLAQRMIVDGYEYELFELRKERDELKAELCEIVRCKDCKHHEYMTISYSDNPLSVCYSEQWVGAEGDNPLVKHDGFCAWGERRSE